MRLTSAKVEVKVEAELGKNHSVLEYKGILFYLFVCFVVFIWGGGEYGNT